MNECIFTIVLDLSIVVFVEVKNRFYNFHIQRALNTFLNTTIRNLCKLCK